MLILIKRKLESLYLFRTKWISEWNITKDNRGLEDITVLNIYALNSRTSKHMKQKLIKLQRQTTVFGDFNIPHLIIDRTNRKSRSI